MSRGRESLGLDLSMLGLPSEPAGQTHRRLASDAESASGGDAAAASPQPEMTHPAVGDASHTQLLASPIGGLVGSPPRSFKRRDKAESPAQQQQAAASSLLDDLLDLIPAQTGRDESAPAQREEPASGGAPTPHEGFMGHRAAGDSSMRSITSLQEWVGGGADDAPAPVCTPGIVRAMVHPCCQYLQILALESQLGAIFQSLDLCHLRDTAWRCAIRCNLDGSPAPALVLQSQISPIVSQVDTWKQAINVL